MDGLNRETLFRYFDRCRMGDGGYCYFHDPDSGAGFSNVADTYWVLTSYQLAKKNPPFLSKTGSWLQREFDQNKTTHFFPYLFWLLGGLRLAGVPIPKEGHHCLIQETGDLLDDWTSRTEIPTLLDDLVDAVFLRRKLSLPLSEKEKQRLGDLLDQNSERPGPRPLLELWARVFLKEESGRFSRTAIAADQELEQQYRHPSFGYVLVPGSSRSDLFVLRSGLSMRSELLAPSEVRNLTNLLLSSQSREGGCGPIGGAVPTLEATCAALEISRLFANFSSLYEELMAKQKGISS